MIEQSAKARRQAAHQCCTNRRSAQRVHCLPYHRHQSFRFAHRRRTGPEGEPQTHLAVATDAAANSWHLRSLAPNVREGLHRRAAHERGAYNESERAKTPILTSRVRRGAPGDVCRNRSVAARRQMIQRRWLRVHGVIHVAISRSVARHPSPINRCSISRTAGALRSKPDGSPASSKTSVTAFSLVTHSVVSHTPTA